LGVGSLFTVSSSFIGSAVTFGYTEIGRSLVGECVRGCAFSFVYGVSCEIALQAIWQTDLLFLALTSRQDFRIALHGL
jgi:hypothetical protein